MKIQAVIFDFDGIMVDSETLHHQAFCRVLDPLHLPVSWEQYRETYIGFDDRDVLRTRYRVAGLPLDETTMHQLISAKARAYLDLIREQGVQVYPGVVDLVRSLSEKLPLAICSGALMSDIEPVVEQLGIAGCFAERVTADQVHVSKPDPESYHEAFRRLARKFPAVVRHPAHCVAIEDTPAGVEAATGAGLRVLAVRNTYGPEALVRAHRVVASLEEVDLFFLDGMVTS